MSSPSPALPTRVRLRQPLLFPMAGPLTERFGPEFFAGIPESPGVYFHFDGSGQLLYIGQSSDLRARIGSYRFVRAGHASRRIARLVHRITRIEWRVCGSPEEAIALEAALLLEYRPPFNRAGVWKPPPLWVRVECEDGQLRAGILTEPQAGCHGPLPSGFRYTFSALVRFLLRVRQPDLAWWDLPCGLTRHRIPPEITIPFPDDHPVSLTGLRRFLDGQDPDYPDRLTAAFPATETRRPDAILWEEDMETLRRFAGLRRPDT